MKASPLRVAFAACILVVSSAVACAQKPSSPNQPESQKNKNTEAAAAVPATPPVPAKTPVDGNRAFEYLRQIVAFGPRSMGSPGHAKVQQYLRARLKGVEVEEDKFLASTPAGEFQLRNFIAKFPGKKDGIIVVAGHYDTEYGIKNFVGANDGGSSTALLLAIADQLRGKKREGYSVWLVWFDGEEAVREFTETDGLYGSRHLAERWRADGTLKKIRALLLTDMIGDSDLHIDRDTNSTEWLLDVVQEAAQRLGYQSYFFRRQAPVVDDHIPFIRAGVPAVDLIDFNYGYENVFWHTPQDTLDKVAPKSLEIVGSVVMEAVRILDER